MQNISGVVLDENTLQPIKGVNVLLVEKDISVKTDKKGYFEIKVIIDKEFTLEFSIASYRKQSVKISNDSISNIIVKLIPISFFLLISLEPSAIK